MNRYLMHISYLGTQFRGVQKHKILQNSSLWSTDSIQRVLELGLQNLKPINDPYVYLSSRTDKGVHALQSTVHVDLESRKGLPYNPSVIVLALNKYFYKNSHDVRILKVQRVSNKFNCRFDAVSRTYIYRLAIANVDSYQSPLSCFIPIEDYNRCYFISNPVFDIEKVKEACKLLIGKHDFRSYMNTKKDFCYKSTVREIIKLEIAPSSPNILLNELCNRTTNVQNYITYNYWIVTVKANSFLYKQIRRIIGTLLGIGQGWLTLSDVKTMLQVPSQNSWDNRIHLAPPQGLYLAEVEYNPNDLIFNDVDNTQIVDYIQL